MVHLRDDLAKVSAPDCSRPHGQRGSTVDDAVAVPALLESGLSVICGDLGDVLRQRLERQRDHRGRHRRLAAAARRTAAATAARRGHHPRLPLRRRRRRRRRLPLAARPPGAGRLRVPAGAEAQGGAAGRRGVGRDRPVDRRGHDLIPETTTLTYHQEGQPDAAKVEERDDTAWRVDDHVFSWGGWSLSTPRVGSSSTGAGRVVRGRAARSTRTTRRRCASSTPTSTARCRSCATATRTRCGPAASTSPATARSSATARRLGAESPPVRFGRLAPLVAPLPVRRASRPDPGVGDLPDVIVIRSELGRARRQHRAERSAAVPAPDQPEPAGAPRPAGRRQRPPGRHLPALARRDARALSDQTIVDPETGELVAGAAIADGQVTDGPAHQAAGYLVDPAAGGVACIGLPGIAADDPLQVRLWDVAGRHQRAAPAPRRRRPVVRRRRSAADHRAAAAGHDAGDRAQLHA